MDYCNEVQEIIVLYSWGVAENMIAFSLDSAMANTGCDILFLNFVYTFRTWNVL